MPRCTIPAASLWVSVRLWVDEFRKAGLERGDRVVLAEEPSVGSLAFLLASLWQELTVAIALPYRGSPELLELFDARLGLGCCGIDAEDTGVPIIAEAWAPRAALGRRSPDTRLITRTSGTGGSPTWVALSDDNLWSVIDSHREHLAQKGEIVLSVLPWHHSFGLIIDLLPALFSASVIIRDPSGGRDPESIIATAQQWGVTWCSMVPLQARRVIDAPGGIEMLQSLRGGVIGGAAATAPIAQVLRSTRLRVGYGQTEASPGICLGEPGLWTTGAIGRPRGCQVRINGEGRLLVQGSNVCSGIWADGCVRRLDPQRWLDTGDLVREQNGDLIYLGRADNNFKLANGRMVDAAQIEHELRTLIVGVDDAMVFSPDGEQLRVCLVFNRSGATPDIDAVRRALGPLAERLVEVVVRNDDATIRTAKGSLDRTRLTAA
jgi:long-subunit acyl-CoA synthetase (AMP-forming)